MIEIRFTGTLDDVNQALSITRSGYKILAKTKPQQMPTDPLRWSIHIKAEPKPIATDAQSSPAKAVTPGHDA